MVLLPVIYINHKIAIFCLMMYNRTMSFKVIDNPNFKRFEKAGFTNAQFKKLDALYLLACAEKVLIYRTVDVDFEARLAEFSYCKTEHHAYYLRFVIQRVGPATCMYELWKEGKGRIVKSGLFERAYERLEEEIRSLIP